MQQNHPQLMFTENICLVVWIDWQPLLLKFISYFILRFVDMLLVLLCLIFP